MKRIIIIALILLLSATVVFAAQPIKIIVNGTSINIKNRIVNKRAFLPIRALGDVLNLQVDWDKKNQAIKINTGMQVWKDKGSNNTSDFYPAITAVSKYFSLLQSDVSGTGAIAEKHDWEIVLSKKAQQNYGIERVWYPIPGMVGSSVRSIPKFEILDGRLIKRDKLGFPITEIAVRYWFIDPTDTAQPYKKYIKVYTVIYEQKVTQTYGKIYTPVVDKERILKKEVLKARPSMWSE